MKSTRRYSHYPTISALMTTRSKKSTLVGQRLEKECGTIFATQLKDDEYVYLNAAEFGEVDIIRSLLEKPGTVNPSCTDYMGRNALLLAMKSENLELLEILVSHMNFYAVEDALLNGISLEKIHLVKLILDHPSYIKMEKAANVYKTRKQSIARKRIERSQFSADITPLMLAAHINNHEIIQLLLDRGHKLEMPHDRSCMCEECETLREKDSLMLELQRLHTYQALASPAYLALTTSDAVSSAFLLRNELYDLAQHEKQFKEEYSALAVQCMDFAVTCIDLCRTSDEVHSLLMGSNYRKGRQVQDPLATVKLAIKYEEKKFVAHSNCQHQIENIFYGSMICIRDMDGTRKMRFFLLFIPMLPILYIIHLLFPNTKVPVPHNQSLSDIMSTKMKVADLLRCPVIKFIGNMASYLTFLVLITIATFRLDAKDVEYDVDGNDLRSQVIWVFDFRVENHIITRIQLILIFYIIGQLLMECKQVYFYGLHGYFRSYYNMMDSAAIALYLASYSMRCIVDLKLQGAAGEFAGDIRMAKNLLRNETMFWSENSSYVLFRNNLLMRNETYWLRGCRLWWAPDDPELLSDCLFAVANVMSFARVTNLMPAWELLGPLQISLGRMVYDIVKFMVLFAMMVVAFVVGMTNLYWYFAKLIMSIDAPRNNGTLTLHTIHYGSGIPAFQSTGNTFFTLYWALFGQSSNDVTRINETSKYPGHDVLKVAESSIVITTVGSLLYAIYNAAMIIILLNMLIAMMSKSFDEIQGYRLEEWKFARAVLWLSLIEHEGTLPVPFNILPQRDFIRGLWTQFRTYLGVCRPKIKRKKSVRRVRTAMHKMTNYLKFIEPMGSDEEVSKMKGNMIRRFLFKLQKKKEEENKSSELSLMHYQRENSRVRAAAAAAAESKREGSPRTHVEQSAIDNSKKTINSLLMPPSVRRRLEEKATEEIMEESKNEKKELEKKNICEAVLTVNSNTLSPIEEAMPPWSDPLASEFTARTELPIWDRHLRELRTLDEEIEDLSDILSTMTVSTCSAIDELSEDDIPGISTICKETFPE